MSQFVLLLDVSCHHFLGAIGIQYWTTPVIVFWMKLLFYHNHPILDVSMHIEFHQPIDMPMQRLCLLM